MNTTYTLGENGSPFSLESSGEVQQHIIAMTAQARRHLMLFSPVLTHRLYDSIELANTISNVIREHRNMRVQILLSNRQPCLSQGHQLINLAQRLNSYIEIRRTHSNYQTLTHDYLLVDKTGYIFRHNFESFYAEIDYHDPLTSDNYARRFLDMWEMSTREQEFLRLHI